MGRVERRPQIEKNQRHCTVYYKPEWFGSHLRTLRRNKHDVCLYRKYVRSTYVSVKIQSLKVSLEPSVSRNVNHWAIIVLLRNNQVLTSAASSNLQWKLSTDLRKCYKKTGNDIACSAEACRELQCAGAAALPGAAGSACAGDHRPRYEIVQKVGPRSMVPPAKVSYGGTRVGVSIANKTPFLRPLTRLLQHGIGNLGLEWRSKKQSMGRLHWVDR